MECHAKDSGPPGLPYFLVGPAHLLFFNSCFATMQPAAILAAQVLGMPRLPPSWDYYFQVPSQEGALA